MIMIELLIVTLATAPVIVNIFRGKQYYAFKRNIVKSRPLLIYCIMLQLFVFIVLVISNNMLYSKVLHIMTLMIVILLMLLAITLYESIYVKEGVYEKGLIIRGFMYEWSVIDSYTTEHLNDYEVLIQLKLRNNRKRRIKISREFGTKVAEAMDARVENSSLNNSI